MERPIPETVTSDLEALKWRLAEMAPADIPASQVDALAAEIGAIRLHLKRLRLEREEIMRPIAHSLGLDNRPL